VIQNIVIDNSHGINGPYNTFFRNRAELYGIFMNTSPASDSQNFIGNQVTNTSSIFLGFYALQGSNHFEFGNMVKGNVLPAGTNETDIISMFAYPFHSFYENISSIPPVKHINWQSPMPLIEAQYRYQVPEKNAICNENLYLPTSVLPDEPVNNEFYIYPNPFATEFILENKSIERDFSIRIYTASGQIVYSGACSGDLTNIDAFNLVAGMYFLAIDGEGRTPIKIIKL